MKFFNRAREAQAGEVGSSSTGPLNLSPDEDILFFCVMFMDWHVLRAKKDGKQISLFDRRWVSAASLSDAFVEYFHLSPPVTFQHMKAICDRSRIQLVAANTDEAHGANFVHRAQSGIFYRKDDWRGKQIFTILHELYEIIDSRFFDVQGVRQPERNLEKEANLFASLVQAHPTWVSFWMDQPHINPLDIFSLRKFLGCSYATALIRHADVLSQKAAIDSTFPSSMVAFLYERPVWNLHSGKPIPALQLTRVVRTQGTRFVDKSMAEEASLHWNIGYAELQDLVKISVEKNSHLFTKNVSLYFSEKDGCSFNMGAFDVLIRPVTWRSFGIVGKVLVQAAPAGCTILRLLAKDLKAVSCEHEKKLLFLS